MKNATNELQILVLVLDAAHMVSRSCICIIIIILHFQLGGSLTNPMFAGQTEVFAIQICICTAKFDICATPFVFSTLEHRTLNV